MVLIVYCVEKYRFPKEDLDYGDIIDMIKNGSTNVWILESEVR